MHPARHAEKLRNTVVVLVLVAIKKLLNNFFKPISAISTLAIFTSVMSFFSLKHIAERFLLLRVPFSGLGTLVEIAMLSFRVIEVVLGVITEHVGIIYQEVKGRPHYLIAETVNFA